MNKSICFAGFADPELPALREAVAGSNPRWECRFAADASAALAALAGSSLDVLVVNISISGGTGAELLRDVRAFSPRTLGFIVGEVADQSLVFNCVGGPHQFIRRPYEPAKLVTSIKRGLSLDSWLASDALRTLIPRLRRLPNLPSTYFNLLKEIESESATTQSLAAIIARDPVVTARLLQMVNSAAFSLAQKVTDPADAVVVLGIETIKSLVMGLQVFSQSDEARAAGLSLEILWEHSLLVAKFARQITLKQTGDTRLAGDAFTAGLLHDVGRIVIASNLPQDYAAVIASARESSRPLHEEETAMLGVNHAAIGAYLLGLWGMPVEIVEATAGHHAPGQTVFAPEFSLLGAVHAANVFAHESGGQTDGLCLPKLDHDYFITIQLEDQLPVWREYCTGEKTPSTMEAETAVPPPVPALEAASEPPPLLAVSEPAGNPSVWPANFFLFGLIAAVPLLLVVAGLAIWHFNGRSHPAPERAIVPPPMRNAVVVPPPVAVVKTNPAPPQAPTNVPAPVVSSAPPPDPFAKVRIQGVSYGAGKSLVIINGRTFGVGEFFDGIQVVAIDQHAVTLDSNGTRKVFKFY
jgi:HD-like signal output (HDOD) protein